MLMYQAWRIKSNKIDISDLGTIPHVPFRHIEKSMLYLTKQFIQWIIILAIKYWFITITKSKKIIRSKWPKVYKVLKRKPQNENEPSKMSYIRRSIIESKIKIKRVKEKIKREHERKI